ncbi:hypothetical protein Q6A89_00395 [Aliarcobacter skirrowii]|uniref:hypothetical protein n=1 Tax=Aliarcobacter skirrowii TaxID=28200 RepID=UPI0029B636CB|nr:hypothetical protein [Aliarcobacter skirrowii]MDX4058968.1 hypothetical protein [Aliarcobacter skirrowii]
MIEVYEYIVSKPFLVLLIGILIGYFISRGQKERFKPIPNSSSTQEIEEKRVKINPIFNKNASLDAKPMVLSASTKKDSFIKIKGINEDLEKRLYDLGIYQYDQIATWTSKNCDWVESFLQLPGYIRSNQWVEQAKILKTGRETSYSQKLLDEEVSEN